jgi:hypothetical protein
MNETEELKKEIAILKEQQNNLERHLINLISVCNAIIELTKILAIETKEEIIKCQQQKINYLKQRR